MLSTQAAKTNMIAMLLQFTFSNFRSFKEAQTLDLAASNYDKKALPENCATLDLPGLENQRWLKGAALYGANASGKSSVLNALEALQDMVILSAKTTDPQETITQVRPFALAAGQAEEPTAFAVVFVTAGVRYEYRVAATRERIWHESLREFATSKGRLWYCRDWQPETAAYQWTPAKPTGYRRDPKKEEFTLRNQLYLSKAISLGDTQLEPVFGWFRKELKFLDLSVRSEMGQGFTISQFDKKTPLVPRILELLRHADLGIQDVRVQEQEFASDMLDVLERMKSTLPPELQKQMEGAKPTQMIVELSHKGAEGKAVPLPWEEESVGTHRLFALLGPWLNILDNGYTVCIDELDTSMHPLMVTALLRLVFNAKTNPKGAQVIFTTHNPLLLDATLMRRDQVWFTDKDEQGAARLYPFSDYAPRDGESWVRGYLSGRYGGIPSLHSDLLGVSSPSQAAALSVEGGDNEP